MATAKVRGFKPRAIAGFDGDGQNDERGGLIRHRLRQRDRQNEKSGKHGDRAVLLEIQDESNPPDICPLRFFPSRCRSSSYRRLKPAGENQSANKARYGESVLVARSSKTPSSTATASGISKARNDFRQRQREKKTEGGNRPFAFFRPHTAV